MKFLINKLRFHIIKIHSLKILKSMPTFDANAVYLTFDDGPEEGITEFVLNELKKYDMKATFFCCGNNCEKNPYMLKRIQDEGHSIANHTYSHINGFDNSTSIYMDDVNKCESYLNTYTFRPPWGALTLRLYTKLRKQFRIIYWDISSGDTEKIYDLESKMNKLIMNTKPGSIVLFHFCKKHENETKILLPSYLKFISKSSFKTAVF